VEMPVVFISSTAEDLKPRYRDAARDAAITAGFHPEMQEYWAAKDNPPLTECLARVSKANVLVVIVAYRFGWVPPEQSVDAAAMRKSITWLECEKAESNGKDVLVFLVDKDQLWPHELREEYELTRAVQQDRLTPELAADVQWRVNRLNDFKAWLNTRTRATFTTPDDLRGKIQAALSEWSREHQIAEGPPPHVCDPDRYLRTLYEETSHIVRSQPRAVFPAGSGGNWPVSVYVLKAETMVFRGLRPRSFKV
jgi:hypothetical protein